MVSTVFQQPVGSRQQFKIGKDGGSNPDPLKRDLTLLLE
jgi:hypothetical protein